MGFRNTLQNVSCTHPEYQPLLLSRAAFKIVLASQLKSPGIPCWIKVCIVVVLLSGKVIFIPGTQLI